MIPVIYDGNCLRPDRSDYLIGKSRKSPLRSLRHSVKLLEKNGAEVIAMPCNTAHYWYKELCRCKRRQTVFPDIITAVSKKCYSLGVNRICLLSTDGTRLSGIYNEPLFRMGIDQVRVPPSVCEAVRQLIRRIKSGESACLTELEKELCGIRCDAFLLACTELSVAFHRTREPSFTYIDSLSALAEVTALACGADRFGG